MGDEFGRILLTIFFPWNFRNFVNLWARKKIRHKIHHHIRAAFGRCLKWVFTPIFTGPPLGDRPAIGQRAYAKSRQQWEAPSLGWLCPFPHAQMAALASDTPAANRIATTLFLLFWGAFLVQIKVIYR